MFCVECLSIPPDYYSDKLENSERNNNNIENRRNLQTDNSFASYVTLNSPYFDSDDDEENIDGFFEIYVATKKSHRKQNEIMTEHSTETAIKVDNTSDKADYSKIMKQQTDSDSTTAIHIFRNYEYIYDDADSGNSTTVMNLRGEITSETKNTTTPPIGVQATTNKTSVSESNQPLDNKTLKYLAEFFNLEPAAGVLKYKKPTKESVNRDKVWYVPEKYPCWELPIIYGELGRKKRVSEIFLVYFSRLKNVIDDSPKIEPVSRKYFIADAAKLVNKWCAVSPCYGDHTLCLFAPKTYSRVCDKEYKVYSPTMSEQMALVSTLNSMRNSVARGTAEEYIHLPTAANMKQMIYDFDLEEMAEVWLRQCLPGVAPCSSLNNEYIIQLECTKYAEYCCFNTQKGDASVNW